MHTTQNEGVDPILERKRRRKEIMDDKRLNIWQKKFMLEELDEQESKPAPAPPKRDVPPSGGTRPNSKPAPSATPKPSPSPTPSPTPTPTPAPTPAPGPAPQPSPTPPPKPAPARSPAPVHPNRPVGFDDTDTPPQESYDERMRKYAAERNGILNSGYIPQTEKGNILDSIDKKYGFTQGLYQKWRVVDDNRSKLKAKTDDVNRLRSGANGLLRQRFDDEVADDAHRERERMLKQADETVKGFGPTVAGLNGRELDPTRVVDITLDGKPVGNARYADGKATGNLGDVVKCLGGDMVWDRLKSAATIYDPDGNIVSYLSKGSNVILEKDAKGNIINRYSLVDGEAQADIEGYAKKFGVPYSYYHDKNGVYRAYAQPEMRGAPITVVRKEGDVYIEANVEFTGNADDVFPGTNYTYAEVAYQGIMDNWNTNTPYNISGQDSAGNYMADENLNVHLNLYGMNGDKNGIMRKPADSKETVKINVNNDFIRSLPNKLGMSSHVFTESPFEAVWNPAERVEILQNLGKLAVTGQKEQLLYDWSIKNPGEMTLYSDSSQLGYGETAAHEFGHLLGLGDAYGASYRDHKSSPQQYNEVNEYGQTTTYYVPKNDMMRSNEMVWNQATLTDNDVRLLVNAWKTGNAQFYKK